MKLELVLAFLLSAVAVLAVPYVSAQTDIGSMLQVMGLDVPSVPRPPQSLLNYYQQQQRQQQSTYQQLLLHKQQRAKEAQQQQRLQQEMELLNKLRAMSAADIEALKKKLSADQLQQLVSRIKYLQQVEQQHKQPGSHATSNLILSGANRIRQPADQNAVSGTSPSASPSAAAASTNPLSAAMARRIQYFNAMLNFARRRMAAAKKQGNPLDVLRKYQSYQKKAGSALGAGCSYPMATEGSMETFMAFGGGGCAAGGAVCMMNGQSCVDVGMSIMCCPPGYTGGTLDMMNYMRQMETFMGQFA